MLEQKCFEFSDNGKLAVCPVPEEFSGTLRETHLKLISAAADDDEKIMQDFIENKVPDMKQVHKLLRKNVLFRKYRSCFFIADHFIDVPFPL